MRIALIDAKFNLESGGGSNHCLHLTASQLARLGHKVQVITLSPSRNSYPDDLPYTVVGEELFINRLDRELRFALLRVLRKYESEVDVYNLWEPGFIPGGAFYRCIGGKRPVVARIHNYSFCPEPSRMDASCYKHCGLMQTIQHRIESRARKILLLPLRVLERGLQILMLGKIDAVTPVSPIMTEARWWKNIDKKKVFVIPPAVDFDRLSDLRHIHTPRPADDGQYNLLYVGRLSQEKGVDLLIEAASRLESAPSVNIVGDGPQRNQLEELSRQLGLSGRVMFHGWLPYERVVDFYLDSQLFIHPARWPEPLSRTVLEAMAHGMPVIAADAGGSPWALQNAGLTFQPDNVEDLVDKIKLVQDNPSLAADMAKKAEAKAKEFDNKRAVSKLLELYENVITASKKKKSGATNSG